MIALKGKCKTRKNPVSEYKAFALAENEELEIIRSGGKVMVNRKGKAEDAVNRLRLEIITDSTVV